MAPKPSIRAGESQTQPTVSRPTPNGTTPDSTKRKRPSYTSLFPPLDEFNYLHSDNSEDEVAFTVAALTRVCSSSSMPTATARENVLNQTIGTGPGAQSTPSQSSRSTSLPTSQAQQLLTNQTAIVATIHSSQLSSSANPRSSDEAGQTNNISGNVRCNGCIISRRKCDGARPACRLCARSGKKCVYEREGITRSYLENMNRQAARLRIAAVSGKSVGIAGTRGGGEIESGKGGPEQNSYRTCITGKEKQSQKEMTQTGNRKWTLTNHLDLLDSLDRGEERPEDKLFDETTKMYAEFKKADGNIVDHWAKERHAELEMRWEVFRYQEGSTVHLPHGDGSGGGLLSNLRQRMGLPAASQLVDPRRDVH